MKLYSSQTQMYSSQTQMKINLHLYLRKSTKMYSLYIYENVHLYLYENLVQFMKMYSLCIYENVQFMYSL